MKKSANSIWNFHAFLQKAAWMGLALAAMLASGTEVLVNRSFDTTNTWQVAPALGTFNPITAYGSANLHPPSGYMGLILYQDLNVTGVGGLPVTGILTLQRTAAPADTNTIAVYLDYVDAGGLTNTLLLHNPRNNDMFDLGPAVSFTNTVMLPSTARTLVRYSIVKITFGSFESPEVSLDVPVPQGIVLNAGFEDGTLRYWSSQSGMGVVSYPTHSGAYAIQVTNFPGPSAFVGQNIAPRLLPDVAYTFTGWTHLTNTDLPPMPMYGPRIRVSADSTLTTPMSNGDASAQDISRVIGWNKLELTRTFTSQELSNAVYFGAIRVGGPGEYVFDDLSVTAAAAPSAVITLTAPTNGEVFTNITVLKLSATVTNTGKTLSKVEFLRNGVVLGEGSKSILGEWLYPDGSHLSVMSGPFGDMLDYTRPDSKMFLVDGAFTDATHLSGSYITWSPDASGPVSAVFALQPNGTLNATLTAAPPLGVVTLISGTNAQPTIGYEVFNYWWNSPPAGPSTLTARAIFTDNTTNESAAVTIMIIGGNSHPIMDTYLQSYGLSGTNAAPMADPDNDGIPNLVEFALGLNPTNASRENLPAAMILTNAPGMTFRQRAGGTGTPGVNYHADGLYYVVQVRSNLVSGVWTNDVSQFEVVGRVPSSNGTETVIVLFKGPFTGSSSRFVRVVVVDGVQP